MTTRVLVLNSDVFCYIGGMGSVRIVALCLVLLAMATSTTAEEPLTISRAWDDLGGWLTAPLHGTTTGSASLSDVVLCWGMMTLLAVVYLGLSQWLTRIVLHKARSDASLRLE